MGLLYLRGHTVYKMGGETIMGSSIYGVVVINGSLYSRFYVSIYALSGSALTVHAARL